MKESMFEAANEEGEGRTAHLLNRRFGFVTPTPTAPAFPTLPSSHLSVFSRVANPSSSRGDESLDTRIVPLTLCARDE